MVPAATTLIQWIGHACFLIATVTGIHILIDPVSPKIGYVIAPQSLPADLIFVSHDATDDSDVGLAKDTPPKPELIGPRPTPGYSEGIFHYTLASGEDKTINFRRVFSYRDNVDGKQRGTNTITVINVDGIRFCHLGDLGQRILTPKQVQLIGPIDVLMIPVGGYNTIGAKTAVQIVAQLHPKVIVPMHFRTQYVNEDLQENLEPVDDFLTALGPKVAVKAGDTNILELSPETLPSSPTVVKFSL